MPATNHTKNYNLPVYISSDIPQYLTDWNGTMEKLDTAIKQASESGSGGSQTFKTINNEQITGTGNIPVQTPLVSGSTIKTINNVSVLGQGNITTQAPLVSGTNIKTINGQSLLGSGNIDITSGGTIDIVQSTGASQTAVMSQNAVTTAVNNSASTKQDKLVSGTNIKTINGQSVLGGGNITISGGSSTLKEDMSVDFNETVRINEPSVDSAVVIAGVLGQGIYLAFFNGYVTPNTTVDATSSFYANLYYTEAGDKKYVGGSSVTIVKDIASTNSKGYPISIACVLNVPSGGNKYYGLEYGTSTPNQIGSATVNLTGKTLIVKVA